MAVSFVVINKGFWRAKLPRFHTKPSNFCNIQIITKSQPYRAYIGQQIGVLAILSMHFPILVAKAGLIIVGHVRTMAKGLWFSVGKLLCHEDECNLITNDRAFA